MEVIPAIDVSAGKVVRLLHGDVEQKTVYADDPAAVARRWEGMGAQRLHVVDLDAAFGTGNSREPIREILSGAGIPVQIGGGIRDVAAAQAWLDDGADRVVLGTAALTDAGFLDDVVRRFPERVVVGLDSRDGRLRVEGWTEDSGLDVVQTAKRLASGGVRRLLCTDIARDGAMRGPNVELIAEVAAAAGVPLIASGGVSSMDDLRALDEVAGVEAVVVGKALYEGRLDPAGLF